MHEKQKIENRVEHYEFIEWRLANAMFLVQNGASEKRKRKQDHRGSSMRRETVDEDVLSIPELILAAIRISCRAFPRRNRRHLECTAYNYEHRATIGRKKTRLRRTDPFITRVTVLKITLDFFRYHYFAFSSSSWISSLVFHICSNREAVTERVLLVLLVMKGKYELNSDCQEIEINF